MDNKKQNFTVNNSVLFRWRHQYFMRTTNGTATLKPAWYMLVLNKLETVKNAGKDLVVYQKFEGNLKKLESKNMLHRLKANPAKQN